MPMTLAQVDAYATTLPGVTVGTSWGNKTWKINEHGFAWVRPLNKADLGRCAAAGETAPEGVILAVRVENLDAKDAMLSMDLPGFFTIEHFNNYPALLIALGQAKVKDVKTSLRAAFDDAAAKKPKPKKKKTTKKKAR